jgi:hypothetical protein
MADEQKTKFVVKVSYTVTLKADTDGDAAHMAQWERVFGNTEVRNLSISVIRRINPPKAEEVPAERTADEAAS